MSTPLAGTTELPFYQQTPLLYASGIASEIVNALTIDLPGAEPGSAHLEMRMIGDPVDTQAHRYLIKNRPVNSFEVPRPWRDLTPHWLSSSTYSCTVQGRSGLAPEWSVQHRL